MTFFSARPMRWAAIALLLSALAGTASAAADAELERLEQFLTGSFSSQAQAAADPDYRDVRLHMAPIWRERVGEHWLYVEQAVASSLDQPYRQRVYQLLRENGELRSRVYTLPGDPLTLAGAWSRPEAFAKLEPAELIERQGCAILLHANAEHGFSGSTHAHDCPSDLKGASYAQSEVTLDAQTLRSWDRGFDANAKQVWGAEKGPYVFVRQNLTPVRASVSANGK